ncbi:POC5 protein, partial [Centropus bengalensis]|nr:POC5 protein [Centropus bengalensis]
QVITNLTQALEKQKERLELMRKFTLWRIHRIQAKQEVCAQNKNAMKVQPLNSKGSELLQFMLQLEDMTVYILLTSTLEEAKAEILRLQSEREQYEDTMKKAFMRGVCALNLEAMTMFQGKDSRIDPGHVGSRRNNNGTIVAGRLPPSQCNPPSPPSPPATATQLEDMFSSHLSHASTSQTRLDTDSPAIITGTSSGLTQKLPMAKVITSTQQKAGRTITARITGRADTGQKARVSGSLAVMGVAPPMSSVIVEKHHPVTQQTISQATAAKYPRTVHHASGSTIVRPAGQVGRMLQGQTPTTIQSIKVVD